MSDHDGNALADALDGTLVDDVRPGVSDKALAHVLPVGALFAVERRYGGCVVAETGQPLCEGDELLELVRGCRGSVR